MRLDTVEAHRVQIHTPLRWHSEAAAGLLQSRRQSSTAQCASVLPCSRNRCCTRLFVGPLPKESHGSVQCKASILVSLVNGRSDHKVYLWSTIFRNRHCPMSQFWDEKKTWLCQSALTPHQTGFWRGRSVISDTLLCSRVWAPPPGLLPTSGLKVLFAVDAPYRETCLPENPPSAASHQPGLLGGLICPVRHMVPRWPLETLWAWRPLRRPPASPSPQKTNDEAFKSVKLSTTSLLC